MIAAPLAWTIGSWDALREQASAVRRAVFVVEMGIDETVDFDGTDEDAVHIVASLGSVPIATGRVRPCEARIGRVAVLREHRGHGYGKQVTEHLVREAIHLGLPEVSLHAQAYAVGFYHNLGFRAEGEPFDEAGIPHQRMHRTLVWKDAVAAVLVRQGRVLLGQRAPQLIMGGLWDLFGGKVEPGEDAPAALQRELREELSIDANIGAFLDVCLYDDPRDGGIFRSPVFVVTEWTGEVALNPEHVAARWFTPREVARLRIAHPDIPQLLSRALEISSL